MPETLDVRSGVLVEPSEGDMTRVKPIFLKVRSQDIIPPSSDPTLTPWYNEYLYVNGNNEYLRPTLEGPSYKYMMNTLSFTTENGWYCEIRSDGRTKLSRTASLTGTNSFFGSAISGVLSVVETEVTLPVPLTAANYTVLSSLIPVTEAVTDCRLIVVPNINADNIVSVTVKLIPLSPDTVLNGSIYNNDKVSIVVEGFIGYAAQ